MSANTTSDASAAATSTTTSGESRPRTLHEAFANTAKALQQFGVERVRVVGLSDGCDAAVVVNKRGKDSDDDGVRVVTEQQFMREFVFHSRPCVIVDAAAHWPAMHKWRSDRYLFELDKSATTTTTDSKQHEHSDTQEATMPAAAAAAARTVTVALTPNGRADAVTYVLYDDRDVPASARARVCDGTPESRPVRLHDHPMLHKEQQQTTTTTHNNDNNDNNDSKNDGVDEAAAAVAHVRAEKVFMYAAEVRVTLPQLYTLLAQSPVAPPPSPTHIDMRSYAATPRQQQQHNNNNNNSSTVAVATPVIAYAQLQNNCLNTEYTHLRGDIADDTVEAFGTRVFGEDPEAANVWFGIPASVSSLHQDWVENLYTVVRGVKEFVLIPPWEGVLVPKPELPAAAFAIDEARSDAAALRFAFAPYPDKDGTTVPWMDVEVTGETVAQPDGAAVALRVLNDAIDACAQQRSAQRATAATAVHVPPVQHASELHPLVVYVRPGETLYLPAMWLHRVAQHADEHDIRARHAHRAKATTTAEAAPLPLIAAVNYWYNMSFVNPAVVMLREFGLLL